MECLLQFFQAVARQVSDRFFWIFDERLQRCQGLRAGGQRQEVTGVGAHPRVLVPGLGDQFR